MRVVIHKIADYLKKNHSKWELLNIAVLVSLLGVITFLANEKKPCHTVTYTALTSNIPHLRNHNAEEAFDGNFDTIFHSAAGATTGYILVQLKNREYITDIAMSPQTTIPERCPKDFDIDGSNDNIYWEKVKNFTNNNYTNVVAGKYKTFKINSEKKYRYIKFNFTGSDADYLAFSELRIESRNSKTYIYSITCLLCLFTALYLCLLGKGLQRCFKQYQYSFYNEKQKTESVCIFLTLVFSILILILINMIIVSSYHVDEKLIAKQLSYQFIEKYRFALWPEPVERIQFLFTLVITPFVLFLSYLRFDKILKKTKHINFIFIITSLLSAVSLIALLYFDLKLNPDNFLIKEPTIFYRDIRNFIHAILDHDFFKMILLVPLIFYLLMLERTNFLKNNLRIIMYVGVIIALSIIFAINIFNRDSYFGWFEHFNAAYYAVTQVVNGKFLLVNLTNQYGLYPHFLNPVFKIIGLSPVTYSLVMSFLVILSYSFIIIFLQKIIRNHLLVFLGFIAVVYCRIVFLLSFNYYDSYFQYTPIRFLFPCLLLLLLFFYFKIRSKFLYYMISVIASIAVLWNIDSGAIVFATWCLTLCYFELFDFKIRDSFKKIGIHLVNVFAVFLLIIASYSIIIRVGSGSFPYFSLYTKYQKIFYLSGFYMMPMPVFNIWNILVLIYIIGLIKSVKAVITNDKTDQNIMVFVLSILGIGLFSYYQGRSHDFNLTAVSYPAVLLLILFADNLLADLKVYGFKFGSKLLYLFVILFFFSFTLVNCSSNFRTCCYKAIKQISSVLTNDLPNKQMTENIHLIVRNTKTKDRIVILPALANLDGIYYGETQTVNAINIPGFSELVLQEDRDKIDDFLKTNTNTKVFICNGFDDENIWKILSTRYAVIDSNSDMKVFFPKTN